MEDGDMEQGAMEPGIRIGGLAGVALSAWLALQPVLSQPNSVLANTAQPVVSREQAVPASAEDATASEDSAPVEYLLPVDAEVVDLFRAPAHVGAPGNRGWEYEPEPGLPVWASAEGEVVFAGSVARNRFVTVLHRDGLRTAYGYLGWIAVQKGDRVAPGQMLGTTSTRFFFSVRDGDRYLDPALVLSTGRVRLVPHQEPHDAGHIPS